MKLGLRQRHINIKFKMYRGTAAVPVAPARGKGHPWGCNAAGGRYYVLFLLQLGVVQDVRPKSSAESLQALRMSDLLIIIPDPSNSLTACSIGQIPA
jgi:hypothetical protein